MHVDKQSDRDKKRGNKLSILSEEGFKMCTYRDTDLPFSRFAQRKGYWLSLIGEKRLIEALSQQQALSDERISEFLQSLTERVQAFEKERSDCLLY